MGRTRSFFRSARNPDDILAAILMIPAKWAVAGIRSIRNHKLQVLLYVTLFALCILAGVVIVGP